MRRSLFVLLILFTGLVIGRSQTSTQDTGATKPPRELSYSKDVAPILEKFCASCHNEDDQHPSDLYMDSYETLMKGGKHGKAILPGNSKESLIPQKMSDNPPFGKEMPPPGKNRKVPTPEQIETMRLWIDQGAKNN